jgi:WD40 repeat protein
MQTGEQVWRADQDNTLQHHKGTIVGIAWSAAGDKVWTASADQTVGCFAAKNGAQFDTQIWRHPEAIKAFAMAKNTSRALTATNAERVRPKNAQAAELLPENATDKQALPPPDIVRVWDPANAKMLRVLPGILGTVTGVAVSADGTQGLVVCDISDRPLGKPGQAATLGSDDTASQRSIVQIFDLASGTELSARRIAAGLIWSGAFPTAGEGILTVGGNGARLWQAGQPRPVMSFAPQGAVSAARFTPDGATVITGSWDHTLKEWNAHTGLATRKFPLAHRDQINGVALSPQGDRFLTVSDDQTAVIWDRTAGKVLHTLQGHKGKVRGGAWLPDGVHCITVGDDRVARIWNAADGALVHQLPAAAAPLTAVCAEWGPAEEAADEAGRRETVYVAIAAADQSARLWQAPAMRLKEMTPLGDFTGHTAAVTCIALSPDARRLLTGGKDAAVKLWDTRVTVSVTAETEDLSAGEQAAQPDIADKDEAQAKPVPAVAQPAAPLPAEKQSGLPKGKEILTLNGHTQEVTAVEFSRDGHRVLSASRDGGAILWLAE